MRISDWLIKRIYFRKHPEAALRYLPLVDYLKKNNLENTRILEVGSGSYGIAPYLHKKVVGVDMDFSEPEYELLKQVKGSGDELPFSDGEFDVVILSDVLEHIPPPSRKKSVDEAIRVASRVILISGPFGRLAAAQDKRLSEYSIRKIGSMHHFFADHLEYGLPEVSDIEKYSFNNKKVKYFKIVGQYLNLNAREWLMKFFITKSKLGYYFYLKGLMPLVPILAKMNTKPCYRTLVAILLK